MKYALIAVGSLVLGMLVGCGPADVNESSSEQGDELLVDGTRVSPEMMAAVLATVPRTPDELLQASEVLTCQPSKVCTGYESCGTWSAVYECGTWSACNPNDGLCKVCETKPGGVGSICEYHGGERQTANRYRVCFNAERESCTEYQLTTVGLPRCGCNNL